MRLNQFFIYLRSAIDGSDLRHHRRAAGPARRPVPKSGRDSSAPPRALFGEDLAAFNRLVRDRNVPAVVVKQ